MELLGPGDYPDIDQLHPRDVDAAARRVHTSGFTLGGPGNTRLLYHLVRGLDARGVIETGVAYGWSSLAILLAQRDLGGGALTSTDMPYPRG
nr:class I SAM-dependent methyltransferase [Solirubrobacterales bacterium]